MEIQGSDRVQGPKRIERKTSSAVRSAQASGSTTPADEVQISPRAQHLAALAQTPDVRMDKILQLREEIANGTYETPEKLDKAIERLLQEFG